MAEQFLMQLPQLNCLKPNIDNTFKKLVEEIGECNTALIELNQFESKHNVNYLLLSDKELQDIRARYKTFLENVLIEIMDIAQTCASQMFVFEDEGINTEEFFYSYVKSMVYQAEEYVDMEDAIYHNENNCKYLNLPRITTNMELQHAMNKIIAAMGDIAQLGKYVGLSGEEPVLDEITANEKYILELFKIIQHCFDLLYNMKEKYNVDLNKLFEGHVRKLVDKGYCTLQPFKVVITD